MLEARRAKVIKVIGVLVLVFGLSLIYFLFFNTGLMLTPDPSNQQGSVIVSNTSIHLIRNISVYFLVNNQLMEAQKIPVLAPNQTHSVALLDQYIWDGKFVVQVSAPYHLSQQVVVQARSNQIDNANVSFTFQYPSLGIVNESLDVEVGACNSEPFPLDVQVTLDLPPEISSIPSVAWNIPATDCSTTHLTFTPTLPSDDLSFKIRVFTPTSVLVEKDHHIQIISGVQSADQNNPSVDNNGTVPDMNLDVTDLNGIITDANIPSGDQNDPNGGT